MRGRAGLTVPLARRRRRRDLPHRPLHQGPPARETAAGPDPGRPWPRPTLAARHPAARPLDPDTPVAVIRIGYARCSTLGQELDSQLDALAKHGIPREKVFSEKISTRIRVRPQFEAALAAARDINGGE